MISIKQIAPSDWKYLSEKAHLIVFNKNKPADLDRIDFALVAEREEKMLGYVTCREFDSETLYWQFGGAFPGTIHTATTYIAYKFMLEWCKERYKRVSTLIESENVVMLKMAMFAGFRISGCRMFRGTVLVELINEFKKE